MAAAEAEASGTERSTQSGSIYDGFISYSHAADDLLAPRVQAGLQRFAKPWWKRRSLRLFRDEASLSANPHLWSSITEALGQSAWFVLLLSPDAAESPWVNKEIDYWKSNRDPARILPVLTDGTFDWDGSDVVGSAAPEALLNVFSEEPRWVDLRFAKDDEQLDLKDPRFADAVADIASALRDIPKDELASEEVRQHRRTLRTAWAAGALLLALGIAAGIAAVLATRSANEAEGRALLAAARNVSESDMDLALLLTLEAADRLGGADGSVEGELHNIFLVGIEVRQLNVSAVAHGKSFAVAERPGTTQVAATAAGNLVGLYEVNSGELISTFGSSSDDFSSSVPSIAFDASGDRLAAIDTQGTVRVWDVKTGDMLTEIDTGEGATGRVLFGPDGNTLITSIHTRTVWSIESGAVVWRSSHRADSIGGVDISYDQGGRWLAWSNRKDGLIEIVDLDNGEELWTIPLAGAIAVDFHPRFDVLAVKSQNTGAQLYDLTSGTPEMFLAIEGAAPTAVAFDPGGELLAIGGDLGVEIYASENPDDPLANWDQAGFLPTGASFGFSYVFLSDRASVAIGHKQGAGIFSLQATGELFRSDRAFPAWTIEAVPGTSLVYTSQTPVVGGNAVYIHDHADGNLTPVSEGDNSAPGLAVASSVSSDAVAAYLPGHDMVAILDPATGSVIRELEHPGDIGPSAIDVSRDGTLVVAGLAGSSDVALWDAETGKLLQRFTLDGLGDIRSIRFNPVSDVVAVGGDLGLMLVDVASNSDPVRLPAEGSLLNVEFSPDGTMLAVADDTFGFLYVYDVASQTRERRISVPGALDPEFTEDGRQLILAGAQSGIIAFDTLTWERRWTIPRAHLPGAVLTLDVVGDQVVFSPIFGPLYGITLDFDELLEIARGRLNRGFREAECVQYRIDPCPTLDEMRGG